VDDALQQRLAANESTFRDVNEAIQSGHWPGDPTARVAFRCECANLGCNMLVEMTLGEYEDIRTHPRRFLVIPGHQVPEAETVLESNVGYSVVEKREEAGRVAEQDDPRTP
jgi:hypothetical protein